MNMIEDKTNKIFISYSGENGRAIAKQLKNVINSTDLDGMYVDCITDGDILPGMFEDVVLSQIKECDLFIVCLTKDSINKPSLLFEIGSAAGLGKKIMPLLVNCTHNDIAYTPLSRYQSFVFRGDSDIEKLMRNICNALGTPSRITKAGLNYSVFEDEIIMQASREFNISTVEDYLRVISSINPNPYDAKKKISNKEAGVFYRGQTSREGKIDGKAVAFDPTPSIFRQGRIEREQEIYAQIMTECAHEFIDCNNHCEVLAKMQHYGVPTRLLDITTNALCALFFACVDDSGKTNNRESGVVFVVQAGTKNVKIYDSDTITILSSLPRFSYDDKKAIKKHAEDALLDSNPIDFFHRDGKCDAVLRLLHEIRKEKPAFAPKINPNDLLSNFIFTPQKTNPRIVRQSGAFVIFGLGSEKLHDEKTDSIVSIGDNPRIIAEIYISKKEDIKRTLEKCGISLATMYPELYRVADYIR